jgi:NAD(P)-dependent dehydrogenase (short-subunit alcohol dehydrogenase family)
MAGELAGKVAAVTGAASGIGLASSEAMLALGSRVVMVDCDEAALKRLGDKHGDAVIGHRPARPEGLSYAHAEGPREGRSTRHPACKRR